MRRFILLAAFGLVASSALAATPVMRQNSKEKSCEAVQGMIKQQGKAVLRWPSKNKPDMTMYSMYVADSTHCVGQGAITGATVSTSDNPKCKVSYCSPNTAKGSVKAGKR